MNLNRYYFLFIITILLLQSSCQSLIYATQETEQSRVFHPEKTDFLWGINGHPLTPSYKGYDNQYLKFSYQEQIKYLKQLNLKIYRADVHVDEKGIWNENPADFKRLVNELTENEIDILPVIFTNPWRSGQVNVGKDWDYKKIKNIVNTNRANEYQTIKKMDIWKFYYDLAYRTTHSFAKNSGKNLKYYQIGNEIAYYIIKNYGLVENGGEDELSKRKNVDYFFKTLGGEEIVHFFQSEEHAQRSIASSAYVAGMVDGIKGVNPDAITVVNGTRIDYGYLKLLNMFTIKYDIIGWNWYSDFGDFNSYNNKLGINVYKELSDIGQGKPIWITELNKTLGSYYGEPSQSVDLKRQIEEIYKLPLVESIIVYELMDRDYKNPDWSENYFGLLRSPFQFSKSNLYKPAFDTYRFNIEEKQFGKEDFLKAVWKTLYKEEISQDQLFNWSQELNRYKSREVWLNEIFYKLDTETKKRFENKYSSKEELDALVKSMHTELLNRIPSTREYRYWKRKLKKSTSTRTLWTELILSTEFYENVIWKAYEERTGFKRLSH